MKNFLRLLLSISVCLLIGFLGSLVTTPSVSTWFSTLTKPSFSPPNWLFAPVWTMLFILMGISLYLVWNKGLKKKAVKEALVIFGIQLVFNFLWSFIFFGLHQPLLAFLEIIILWLLILQTFLKFRKISSLAGYFLLPYLIWVTFAAFLNFTIARLN